MKEYHQKAKSKDIFTNCIKIIIVFAMVQIIGITSAFKFFNDSLIMTLISIIAMNVVAYYAVFK